MKGKSISGSVLDVSKGYTKLYLAIDQSQDSSQGAVVFRCMPMK